MKSLVKLIYKTYATYLPTVFPAHYYGMPNGKIYLVFSRFYKLGFGVVGIEFIFAIHEDFLYDYKNEIILPSDNLHNNTPVFEENVDKPNSNFRILKTKRNLNSYGEALEIINREAEKMNKSA